MVLFLKENKRDFSLVNLHPESPEVETVASNLSANLRANSLKNNPEQFVKKIFCNY